MSTHYTYELKCRRCGNLIEFYIGEKAQLDQLNYPRWKAEKQSFASEAACEKCEKPTLHDVVAFGEKEM